MRTILILILAVEILGSVSAKAQVASDTSKNQMIFPKGEKGPTGNFTGTVWVNLLVPNDSILNCVIGSVTFEAGARTNWHYHPGGQILLVTAGTGRYQEKGKKVQIIRTGDVIKCLPNIEHWHGATQDGAMTHLAISLNTHKGIVTWLRSVTDQEYTPGN